MAGLFTELKRRNVFRVGVAYAIVAWLLVEVASVILPTFGAPEWVMKVFTFLVILGFPLALILAWAFELTPEGIKRETEVDRADPITQKTSRKLDIAIIGLLVVAVVFMFVDNYVLKPEEPEVIAEQVPVVRPVAQVKSIAVLPFVNMSADPDNEYFSDGISEELLNVLSRIPDLKVAARTSAFEFKGQNRSVAEIGRLLKVSNVLEGSVRKAGSRVRVTAQLIKVEDGFHLWSDTFDRELTDIFAIQDEIAAAIATALKTTLKLSTDSTDNLTGTNSIEAYEFYLQGMQNWHLRELSTLRKAEELFLRAIEIDPDFAKAHAGLALTYTVIYMYSGESVAVYRPKVTEAAGRALAIDPRNAEALAAMGDVELDPNKGAARFEQAISINPSFATAYQWYGDLRGFLGGPEEAVRSMQRAFELDPRSRIIGTNLAWWTMILGRSDEALRLLAHMETFAPDYNENLELEFILLLTTGQREAAEVIGKRLANQLNKSAPNLGPYLDLFGDASQREAASEEILSWPRGSRMAPDSPAILYDYSLTYLMAAASQYESALELLAYTAKRQPRWARQFRLAPALSSFNCTPDAQAIYESIPFASAGRDDLCPAESDRRD
jgi:TolB-like protein/Tfp pilus assembly protein PilF